jgi:hypothetical protein
VTDCKSSGQAFEAWNRRARTMTLDEWISRFDNEEADKLTQDEQIEIKSMLIELRERRVAAARNLEWLVNQIKEG